MKNVIKIEQLDTHEAEKFLHNLFEESNNDAVFLFEPLMEFAKRNPTEENKKLSEELTKKSLEFLEIYNKCECSFYDRIDNKK